MNITLKPKQELIIAICAWIAYIIAICLLLAVRGFPASVGNSYILGALRWLHGENLYNSIGRGFIYLPTSAIFYIPFAVLPFALSEIFSRIVALSVLALALFNFAGLVKNKSRAYLILTLVTLPLGFSCARNGQFNIMLLAMMLFAVVFLAAKRWWYVTFFLMLGFALKPTMIVLVLLLWVLYRPLWWRIPIGLAAVLLTPFLFQDPQYVITQYHNSLAMLKTTAGVGYNEVDWAQIFCLLAQAGILLSMKIKLIISAAAAFITLYFGFVIKKKFNPQNAAILLFAIAACYLLLFNPRTENNDYVILAPAIGIFLYQTWQQRQWVAFILIALLTIGIALAYYISISIFPGHYFIASIPAVSSSWFSPLMGLVFSGIVANKIISGRNDARNYFSWWFWN